MRHVFLRHPALPNAASQCYGNLDVALPADALREAAARLRGRLDPLPVLSSPSQRCRALAVACAGSRVVAIEPRLAEMDFGRWQGHPWSAIARSQLDAWRLDVAHFRPPGGECFVDVIERLRSVLDGLARPHLLFTHAGVIRAAMHLAGMTLEQAAAEHVPHAEPIELRDPAAH